MGMDFAELNYLAVLVVVVGYMIVGSLWYSPVLFGKAWMKLINKKREELGNPGKAIAGTIVMAIVGVLAVALLVQWTGAADALDGLKLGLLAAVIVAATMATNFLYENRPFALYALNAGYHAVTLLVAGIVLSVWA